MLPGVDLSVWNEKPADWRPLAGAIDWAAVKLSQVDPDGTVSLDPDAAADWISLKAAGKGRIGYLFARPAASVTATAAAFSTACRDLGLADGDGIAVDLEVTDGLSPARVASWAVDLTALLGREFGRPAICYTFLAFAWAGNCAGLGHLPLWIADPSSPKGRPRIPAPWKTAEIQQWGQTGIDRDAAFYESLAAMQAALGKTTAPDPRGRKDDDMPSGTLLTPGPTPIRCEQRTIDPYSQLLLSGCKGSRAADLVVSIQDADGSYDREVSVDWDHPGIVSFRHPRRTKAISVARTDDGTDPIAYLLT